MGTRLGVLISSLQQLETSPRRTIVINVNTDLVATRAVLSAIDVVGDPVLLVNCDPTDSGRRTFESLATRYRFDTIEAPVRDHGTTLDWLFSSLRDDLLLLLDSDAEILDASFVARVRAAFEHPRVFGAGFTLGAFYLTEEWHAPERMFLQVERPWMACVMFRRSPVHDALDAGYSFHHRFLPNEVAVSPRLSRFLAARFGPPWTPPSPRFNTLPGWLKSQMATWRLEQLRFARARYHGLRPAVALFDTGASIYHHLRFEKELLFAGLPAELIDGEVQHYSGVTRHSLFGPFVNDIDERSVEADVVARLATRYGHSWAGADRSCVG